MRYHFTGEAQECTDYYGVLMGDDKGDEYEVQFHRDGLIRVERVTCPLPEDVSPISDAARADAQVAEQVALFLAGKPCSDLTGM